MKLKILVSLFLINTFVFWKKKHFLKVYFIELLMFKFLKKKFFLFVFLRKKKPFAKERLF